MVHYYRIDAFEDVNVNKTSESKECDTCQHWYFLIKGFKFQPNVWNGCHDALIAILSTHSIDYCCIINGISKSGAIGLLRNSSLYQKRGTLW